MLMASIDPDIQAQCLDLIRGIKSAHGKQNDLLGRLVSFMADPTVESEPDKKVKKTSSNNSMSTSSVAAQSDEGKSDGEASSSGSDAKASVIMVAEQESRPANIYQLVPHSYAKRLRLFSIADDALPTPIVEAASARPSLDTNSGIVPLQSNFSPRIPENRKSIACLVDSWKYWYPRNWNTNTDTSADLNVSPVSDFMPWWQFTRGTEKNWYHIDDMGHEDAIPWREQLGVIKTSDVDPDADVNNYGSSHKIYNLAIISPDNVYYFVEVPYSYLPGFWTIWHELKENGDLSNHSTPEPSLNKSERDNVRQSLGDLYAAPQDGRIPLAFHTSELRMKLRQRIADDSIDRRLSAYLDNTRFLLKRLSHFIITDLTARGGTQNAVYEGYRDARSLQPEGPSSHIEGQKCWTMVQPALQRESNGFLARPSFVGCRRHGPLYGEGRWCRVIRLGGLATAVASMIQGQITNANAKKVWSHLFDSNRTFESGELAKVMDKHLFCRPSARDLRGSNNESFKGFHLSWYQLCERPADGTTTRSTWKRGRLYGSQDCFVEQKAFTLGYFASKHYNHEPETIAESFWTLLILGTLFKATEYPGLHPAVDREYRAKDIMLALIRYGLQEVADAWDSVRTALGSIIDPEPQFLDPTEHDNLLFDDDTFSRSREYFWVVTCLESFQAHVDDAIEEWRNFHEGWPKMMMSIDPDRYLGSQKPPEELTSRVRNEIETQVDRLRDISARFKASRENTMALREGLFSASGVIESRVSTRLGENVKLLTYVSIFYLPLSFCVALWSTNESYARPMLVLTSVLVAAATFIVVANLRNMTSVCSAAYRGVRRRIVRRMHDDVHDEWVNRASAFESYRPERLEVEPSEWYILYFVVYSISSHAISWIKRQPHNLKDLFRLSTSDTSSVGSGTTTRNSPVGSETERSSISSTSPNIV